MNNCRNRKKKNQTKSPNNKNKFQFENEKQHLSSTSSLVKSQKFSKNKNKNNINNSGNSNCKHINDYDTNEDIVTLYDSNGRAVGNVNRVNEPEMSHLNGKDRINSNNDAVATPETREKMTSYWVEHSQSKINKSLMLLMEDNPTFEELERKEILEYLPNFSNMDCIELGAGIGRFTNELGKGGVKSLLAIDFMEKFITVNENTHKKLYPNIDMKFKCQDVCTLILNSLSFDFVFSNWLMMYLDDKETIKLAEKMYKWCRYDGYIFFRESCEGGASGDKPRSYNPTHYRKHEYYTQLFDNISKRVNDKNGKLVKVSVNKVKIYVDLKNKTNQYCWLYQKKRI